MTVVEPPLQKPPLGNPPRPVSCFRPQFNVCRGRRLLGCLSPLCEGGPLQPGRGRQGAGRPCVIIMVPLGSVMIPHFFLLVSLFDFIDLFKELAFGFIDLLFSISSLCDLTLLAPFSFILDLVYSSSILKCETKLILLSIQTFNALKFPVRICYGLCLKIPLNPHAVTGGWVFEGG